MFMDFNDIQDIYEDEVEVNMKGKAKVSDEDLSKSFKEVLKCPFSRRIVEFCSPSHRMPANAKIYDGTGDPEDHVGRFVGIRNQGEWPMSVWCRMFKQTLDGKARAWFDKLPSGSIDNWGTPPQNLNHLTPTTPTTASTASMGSQQGEPKQLEIDLESGKLNHLEKDVRHRGRVGQRNNSPQKAKVINMVQCHSLDRKRKTLMTDEKWMNVSILFPPVLARNLSKEALVIEAEVEGYLVQSIHIDEGESIEIMFEHCFNMLHPTIRSRLVKTQTTVSGFSREQVKPLRKIELDVCFGGSGLCQRAIMKFTIIPEPSPYNIILGRPGLKQLREIPSTIHRMMMFLTPCGVATLSEEKGVLFRKKPGDNQGSGRMVEGRDSQARQIPHLDIKPSLVKKVDGSWRMCIDFKNINAVCPKDSYPLPEIDSKIEAAMGFPIKCFLDAYKGYHQVQMAEEDEEKPPSTWTKSFRVEEGKFLGYMVTSEGIQANPAKTKDIAEMQSPRTWGDIQSLAGNWQR
nr:reverse transcriptase domain-containing protein [Tanacetum cinerariifolium]